MAEKCQHDGCAEAGVACQPPDYDGVESPPEFYCSDHASLHGYCPVCCEFWGGISTFEMSGYCDHCYDELVNDADDDDFYFLGEDGA